MRITGPAGPASGSTRVDQLFGPTRCQQTPTADRRYPPPRRHPEHPEPVGQRHHGRADRGHRIRPRTTRRGRHHRIRCHRPQQHSEDPAHRLQPATEAAQPTPHRLHRPPQPGRDPPMPATTGPGHQRRPDHHHRVRPPQQQPNRQQHMRAPATGAPGPPRPQPHHPDRPTHPPGPGITPTRQHARTSRTRQPTRHQPPLDRDRITAYRDQRRLRASPHGPPAALRQEKAGGPPQPGRHHGAAEHEQGQPPPWSPSSHAHPQRRRPTPTRSS